MKRIITAAFPSRTAADAAIMRLEKAGVGRSQIRLLPENAAYTTTGAATGTYAPYDTTRDDKGFWASLGDMFMPDEDRSTYTEALHRGHVLVSVTADDALAGKVEDILDDEGTLDLEKHESDWRKQGWAGYSAAGSSTVTSGTRATGAATNEAIPIVEERLNVGKRVENSGRVRVRSYVVETPVHEQVSLRQEHVSIERRPIDRALTAGEAAFKDRTIEATESSERAVVSKESRVTEEVVVRKSAETRTETVNDTVRKTEVEVEDDRQGRKTGTIGGAGLGTPGARKV